jgi:transcriptional regulator with GAF, ATPase, and Fis domain
VGRGRENDLVLDDPEVPEIAFSLARVEDGFRVTSADARLRLNGKRCGQGLFRIGDLLEFGPYRAILDLSGPEPAGPSRPDAVPPGLSRLCALVAEEHDLRNLLKRILDLLVNTLGGDAASLLTLDPDGKAAVAVSTAGADPEALLSDTIVGEVLRTRRGLCVPNAFADPGYSKAKSVIDLRLRSVLCAPILSAGRLAGVVYLGSHRPDVSYGEADLRELEVYSLVAGCLINHVDYITLQSKVMASLRDDAGGSGIVAGSAAMVRALEEARAVATGDIAVLLEGETGTGKDVLAQYIHRRSRRASKPFLVVNCATLRGETLASELFGHKRGSFTGALADHPGLFSAAAGGTLFLDEVGEMDLALQSMLLRALETGRVRPVGSTAEVPADVRLICATNRDLEKRVEEGAFRQDLYFRINQHLIKLPPLRDRGGDILLLAQHFLEKAKAEYPQKPIAGFHPESLFAMTRYRWPGNVRELANAVRKAALFADSPVLRVALPENKERWMDLEEATRRFQSQYLQRALELSGGDREKAAGLLGVSRSTFFRYLAQAREAD